MSRSAGGFFLTTSLIICNHPLFRSSHRRLLPARRSIVSLSNAEFTVYDRKECAVDEDWILSRAGRP